MSGLGDSKTSVRKLEAKEKQRQALELRKAGATYEVIARQLGYAAPVGAEHAVKAALKTLLQEPAEEVRKLELERLDALLIKMYSDATRGNQGAVDRVLRIMERRARLLGLDAPVKQDVTSDGKALRIEVTYADAADNQNSST